MRLTILTISIVITIFFCAPVPGQVLDVNEDQTVGAHEAIAVAEGWKGPTVTANSHDHLGQTWAGEGRPLKLSGSFEERIIPQPGDLSKDSSKAIFEFPSAPLVLENANLAGYGLKVKSDGSGVSIAAEGPDLIFSGDSGIVAATSAAMENLTLLSNNNVYLYLDHNRDEPHTSGFYIFGRDGYSIVELGEEGDMWLRGTLTEAMLTSKIDHPLDPENKYLVHSAVESCEMKNVYDGVVALDSEGQGWVSLPEYIEAYNSDFRYQLTPIGGPARDLHIAEEIQGARFKIAGGVPGQKVSWQVTGVRKDPYAKANPLDVEQEKNAEERGKYLHPEFLGESRSKSLSKADP